MAETVAARAGTAAILINRTHTYRNLFLPISAVEKILFDLVDRNRSIGEMVERTPSRLTTTNLYLAPTFFEQLWWLDQVVFDASPAQRQNE